MTISSDHKATTKATTSGEETADLVNFDDALADRYHRLSLLTLDLAAEAGEAALHYSQSNRENKPSRFDRHMATMTRAIWAHQVIERLRRGSAKQTNDRDVKEATRHDVKREQVAPAPPAALSRLQCGERYDPFPEEKYLHATAALDDAKDEPIENHTPSTMVKRPPTAGGNTATLFQGTLRPTWTPESVGEDWRQIDWRNHKITAPSCAPP